jgi:hypothetical protein
VFGEIQLRDGGKYRSRLLTVATFAAVLAAGGAWATQCEPAAQNVTVGTAHVSCPTQPAQRLASQQRPGTAAALVPGSPVGLLACRYHGIDQPQPAGSFAAAATLAPTAIAAALNQATPPPSGIVHCPLDWQEVIVLRFVYTDPRILTVNVNATGCRVAYNGDHSGVTPLSVLSTLDSSLGHDPLPGGSGGGGGILTP